MKYGKFIVFDGSDGSGKQTQVAMLAETLRARGEKVFQIDFPHYEGNFHGQILKASLRGDFGNFISLDPYVASFLYTADRFESRDIICDHLASGHIVIADRFTTANMIHQGGKFKMEQERNRYLSWLLSLEFGELKFPYPDLIFFLKVPVSVSLKLLENKKGKDLAEKSSDYLSNSLACAEAIAADYKWHVVECAIGQEMRSRESIHQEVLSIVEPITAAS